LHYLLFLLLLLLLLLLALTRAHRLLSGPVSQHLATTEIAQHKAHDPNTLHRHVVKRVATIIAMAPIALSPGRAASQLDSLAISFDDTIRFYLNGTRVVLDEVDPEVTLLEYLRGIGLTGTKL
jgi:hypothetical protein